MEKEIMENYAKKNIYVHPTAIVYPNVILHENVYVGPYCIIGEPTINYYKNKNSHDFVITEIGANSILRSNTIIYENVHIGENFQTGHHVTIREDTIIGNNCSIGTLSDIQGKTEIGNYTRIHSNVFVAPHTKIGSYVWLFPHVVITDDKYPPLDVVKSVVVEDYAIVAAGAILLPGVIVKKESMVASGSIVAKNVEEGKIVMGIPAEEKGNLNDIIDEEGNKLYPWKDNLREYRSYPWQNENEFQKQKK